MPYATENTVSTKVIDGGGLEISDDQYKQAIAAMVEGKYITVKGGFQILDAKPEDPVDTPAPTPPTPQQALTAQLATINMDAEAEIAPYTNPYPPAEQKTWDTQAREAAAYAADNTAATPWCDIAAAQRGIDRVAFIQKVQAKTEAFVQVSATVFGYRQGLEDQLDTIDLTASDALDQIAKIKYVSPLTES